MSEGWGSKFTKAKKGQRVEVEPMIPGVTKTPMEILILKKYGSKITGEMQFMGIPIIKFVYRSDSNTFEEA